MKDPGRSPFLVVDVVDRDADGDLYVCAVGGGGRMRLLPGQGEVVAGAPRLGDRLLVRRSVAEGGEIEARLMKRLGQGADRVLGVVRKFRRETRVEPVDRRARHSVVVADVADLRDGDLVMAHVESERPHGPRRGRVVAIIGRENDPRAASLIAAHANGLPVGFSDDAMREARAASAPDRSNRTDLTALPLVTIDPPDARDHDDAVFAEPDTDPRNPHGWIVWVAIADVAAFVRSGSALDRAAREKGNSAYFPDRVEPMLPETLSAGLCSLVEGELRACLAVRMVFDAAGRKRAHRFARGLMRSVAKLTYEEAQAIAEGASTRVPKPLADSVITPLWGAYAALKLARDKRSPLEIISAERRVELDADGQVVGVRPRMTLIAHRLIEEFMIQANVCAAETLERRHSPLIYRVHDAPSADKIESLADFLATLGITWSKGEAPRTSRFNRLLAQVRKGPHAEIVNEVVLRTQMQAMYATDNIGHFGLNLDRYAHFTSPIRRYADLIVHRALISALDLGDDGLSANDLARLGQTAEHLTATERRAMAAERDAIDRYVAAYLSERTGAEFEGRVTGVTRFGLFIRLSETGADGLAPISSLGDEYFVHDESAHCLVGERSGARWRLGAKVEVRLREATPLTGGLLFEMISEPEAPDPDAPRQLRRRGRDPDLRRGPAPAGRQTRRAGRSRRRR